MDNFLESILSVFDIFKDNAETDVESNSLMFCVEAKHSASITNAVSKLPLLENYKVEKPKGVNILVKKDNVEEHFFIGDEAIAVGDHKMINSTGKVDNDYLHIPLLGMLASEQLKSEKIVNVSVTYELPIEQYKKENIKVLKTRIAGKYEVTLLHKNGDRGDTVTIILEHIKIVPGGSILPIDQTRLSQSEYNHLDVGAIPVILQPKANLGGTILWKTR